MSVNFVLSQHDILEPIECDRVLHRIVELRGHWTKRSEDGFFTLGAASYLDASPDRARYLASAEVANPVLKASFASLLERVRVFLEDLLGSAVAYHPRFALPGFHVYVVDGTDRSGDDTSLRAHFDLQWMHLFSKEVPAGTLSFTVPIEQPTGGASMEVWHTTYDGALRLGTSARSYAARHPSQRVPYVRGRMVVHDGLVLHAIGRAGVPAPSGHRVTLQGHGIQTPEGWILYW